MTPTGDAARAYSRAHGETFKEQLLEMLRIPSLSGDPAHAGDIKRMAEWLADAPEIIGTLECRRDADRRTSGRLRRMARRWSG